MWKLTIEDDEGKQTVLPLAQEEYGIGRGEANAVRLTDRNVSRNHATIKKNGTGWILKDHQSYNGTYVNSARVVGESPLKSGDVVNLADYRMELVDEATATPGVSAVPAEFAVKPVHQRPNRLIMVVGPAPGQEFPLDGFNHMTIGRSEEMNISVNHSSVSRLHAELFSLGGGRFEIIDKGSANGIRINGVELKRGILEAGDALELGDVRFRFVGAGKVFRAPIDQSQQLAAVATLKSDEAKAKRLRLILGVAGAAIFLAIAGLIGLLVFTGDKTVTVNGRTVKVTADTPQALKEAVQLLGKKDYEGAHKKALEVPENSPARDEPAFKDVEGAWADWMFTRVDEASDRNEKKRLLREITATPSVDPERRTKAAAMLKDIEAKEAKEAEEAKARANPGPVGTGPLPTASATAAPGSTVIVVPKGTQQAPPDEEALRKALEPKMNSGRASLDELKMLKAICSHLGNRQCRDRAAAEIRKKLDQQN